MFNEFVIGGWVGPHQSEDQYLLYKEAGFNVVLDYLWEGDDYTKTLSLSNKKIGLKTILNLEQRFLILGALENVEFIPHERQ